MVYCRCVIFWIEKTLYGPGGSFSYSYDAMGNQTSDGRKGLQISYNILNLPCGVTSAASGSLTLSRKLETGLDAGDVIRILRII